MTTGIRNRNSGGQQEECEEEWAIDGEGLQNAGGGDGGRQRAVEAAGSTMNDPANDCAGDCQKKSAEQDDSRKPAHAIREVEESLCQPLMGKVEVPRSGFAWIGGLAH